MQKTDEVRLPEVKSTRIHPGCFHTRIDQPGSGVAETSVADEAPMSSATRPPVTW
ncbi:protein of unknown function [Streptantibioticus cattleyicolor NRRL 8057 = DSM 46488]|nr:protein of unknown function [Streptantibioticus cattleyicolor NRRL 8057 = DSM 46488]